MSLPQLFSGARGVLKINNGSAIGFVTDVNVQNGANVRAVHCFGAANAKSVEPLSTNVSVSIGKVIPMNNPTGGAVNTSNIALGIENVIGQMLKASDISIQLMDQVTDQIVADIRNCRFAGGSTNLSAQQIAQGRIQLVGLYDAAGGNIPDAIGL
jgi:hypothetical protein